MILPVTNQIVVSLIGGKYQSPLKDMGDLASLLEFLVFFLKCILRNFDGECERVYKALGTVLKRCYTPMCRV